MVGDVEFHIFRIWLHFPPVYSKARSQHWIIYARPSVKSVLLASASVSLHLSVFLNKTLMLCVNAHSAHRMLPHVTGARLCNDWRDLAL